MSELFLTVLNMSLTASYVILFVILVRLLFKKAPKVISYALWGVVAFRLIIPFSFESIFSLMPRNTNAVPIPHDIVYQQSPQFNSGIEVVDSFVSQSLPAPTAGASVNPLQVYIEIGAYIWILGMIALLVYSLVSVLLLKRQLKGAKLIEQNILEAKNLKTPFILGLIRPKIYLPVELNATERNYILLHEQTHIQRKDHIIKVIAFLILSIHWFNPLVWIAFILMNSDMELSCDESVIKKMGPDIKKEYSSSLLSLSTGRKIIGGGPIAFGENNIKGRIKNVLNYKEPKFWVVAVAVAVIVILSVGLLSNPSDDGKMYKIDETKVVRITGHNNIKDYEVNNQIWHDLIDEINNVKWSDLSEDDFPDVDKIDSSIAITLARDVSVDNKEYMLFIYRNKHVKFLGGNEYEYSLALAYDDLTDNIKIWSLPEESYYKIRDILTDEGTNEPIENIEDTVESNESTNYKKINAYLKEEFTNAFSPYYELLDFIISDYHEEVVNGKVEAVFNYKMINKNYDRDPDTVEYIKEAKERDDKYYQIYYDEYLQPKENNFYFKAVIDENDDITLYTKNLAIENDEWNETKMSDYIIKQP